MNHKRLLARIEGVREDGLRVWLTPDDRWSIHPSDAELIEDEAHGDIRLLEADTSTDMVREVRLVEIRSADRMAS